MTPEEKIVQALAEAHGLESAMLQTLAAHVAITPASEYRDLLEGHADETRAQLDRLTGRLEELGESRGPLQVAYGLAQTAVSQLIAAGRFPLELVRGAGSEERLLRNAKDEAAAEALEIVTYDALEALATAAGDEPTASLARRHRAEEEAMLAGLRETITLLARDAYAADVEPEPAREPTVVAGKAREVAAAVRTARFPIDAYDDLKAAEVIPKLRLLTAAGLDRVEEHERATKARKRVLERIATLRSQTNGSHPADPRL